MELQKLKELLDQTTEDKELFLGYQANIAMFVYDAIRAKKKTKPYLSNKDLHEACNEGATNFLRIWSIDQKIHNL